MSKASFVCKSSKVLIKRRQGGNRLKESYNKTSTHPPRKPQNPIVLKTESGGHNRNLGAFSVPLSWLNADHIRALNGRRGVQLPVHLVPGINLNCLVISRHMASGAANTCNDDWVSSGWAKFQCHLMLVFMNCQVVLVCKSLKRNRNRDVKKK